jgi:hypothetical protein
MRTDEVAHLCEPSHARFVEEAWPAHEIDRNEEVTDPALGAESIADLLGAGTAVVEREQQRPAS